MKPAGRATALIGGLVVGMFLGIHVGRLQISDSRSETADGQMEVLNMISKEVTQVSKSTANIEKQKAVVSQSMSKLDSNVAKILTKVEELELRQTKQTASPHLLNTVKLGTHVPKITSVAEKHPTSAASVVPEHCSSFALDVQQRDIKYEYLSLRPSGKTRPLEQLHEGIMANLLEMDRLHNLLNVSFIHTYGGLIGWGFNKHTLPWDTDLDVHISEQDGKVLGSWIDNSPDTTVSHCSTGHMACRQQATQPQYKGTIHEVKYSSPHGKFLFYRDGFVGNAIEFRLVHTSSGVYTDIQPLILTSDKTVLSAPVQGSTGAKQGTAPLLVTKSSFRRLDLGHNYYPPIMLPPVPCSLNGLPQWCPRDSFAVLATFGANWKAPMKKGHKFEAESGCWRSLKGKKSSGPKLPEATHLKLT